MPPVASSASGLKAKLETLSKRLEEELSQRARKRVHAALGAVKKQLADAEVADQAAADATSASAMERQEARAAKRQKRKEKLREHRAAESTKPIAEPKGMNRIERKRLLLGLNSQLAMCAKRKKLKRARELFDEARETGLAPDAHSWTNLVNCLARCGRPDEASAAVEAMREAGVAPNVVTYTALVKGLCAAGDVGGAAAAVRAAEADGTDSARPNARMGSSLLRGCVRVGAVRLGESTLEALWSRWECAPDGAALEAVATLLGQALRPRAIDSLLTRAESTGVSLTPAGRAAMHLAAARAHALLGQLKAAGKACAALAVSLEEADAPIEARGGAVGIDAGAVADFSRLRRAELQSDAAAIEAFVSSHGGKGGEALPDVLGALTGRVISFVHAPGPADGDEGGDGDGNGDGTMGARLVRNLWDTFGLGVASRKGGVGRADVEHALTRRLDGHGHLRHLRARKGQRLVVEICAGSGEWICAQAAAAAEDMFVAVELRADRGYNAHAKALLQGVPNVHVVVGDAREIVGTRLAAGSVDAICINHPEPPEWAGGGDDSDGLHLLDTPFLRACRDLLAPNGTLAIVTDNRRYSRTLGDELAAIGGFENVAEAAESAGQSDETTRAPAPAVLPGLPPASCGYAVRDASSFFDRLWANGKKTKRYHLALRRVGES